MMGLAVSKDACNAPLLPSRPPLSRGVRFTHWLLLTILSVVAYANSLHAPFQYDDYGGLVDNAALKDPRDYWAIVSSGGPPRPLVNLSYALNYAVHGLDPRGYHFVNLILHTINGLLVYELCGSLAKSISPKHARLLFPLLTIPFLTAALFVTHPVQTEAVTYIWGRSDLLFTCFCLLSLLFFLRSLPHPGSQPRAGRWSLAGALAAFILALASKETALCLPLLFLLCDYAVRSRSDWRQWRQGLFRRHTAFFTVAALRIWLRYSSLTAPGAIPQLPSPFRAEVEWISGLTLYTNLLTQCRALFAYVALLLFPAQLNVDHDFALSHSLFEPSVLAAILGLGVLLSLAYVLRHRSPLVSFGLCWFLISSAFFFAVPLQDFLVERRLYFPSVGFFLCLSVLLWTGMARLGDAQMRAPARGLLRAACVGGCLVAYVLGAMNRNSVWSDPYLLWSDAVTKSPDKLRPHINLAAVLLRQQRFGEAVMISRTALTIAPTSGQARYNLLDAYLALAEWGAAVALFSETLETSPSYAVRWLIDRQPRLGEHAAQFSQVVSEREGSLTPSPESADVHVAVGLLYLAVLRDREKALLHLEEGGKFALKQFHTRSVRRLVELLRQPLHAS